MVPAGLDRANYHKSYIHPHPSERGISRLTPAQAGVRMPRRQDAYGRRALLAETASHRLVATEYPRHNRGDKWTRSVRP